MMPEEPHVQTNGEGKPTAPAVSLPTGGGAIRGMGETFAANPVTGTGTMTVPIATSPGRSGFGPQLSLSYDSGSGNGPFGFGWSLGLPRISRKTDKGLPHYHDAVESDVFILSAAEDLVPVFRRNPDGGWATDADGQPLIHEEEIDGHRVRRFQPRIEGLFARIERWARRSDGDVHWRSLSRDNILTIYGGDENSRIADPERPQRIFCWLISESRDDKGNAIRYLYLPEDGAGAPLDQAHQRNRGRADDPRRSANRYIHRILYGNRNPLLDDQGRRPRRLSDLAKPPTDNAADWLFEVRFDYGELDGDDPTGAPERTWAYRPDAFSNCRSGFEVRTCRRCERVLMLHHIPDWPAHGDRPEVKGYQGVAHSTAFVYDDELDPSLATRPVYSFLKQVVQTGWTQVNGSTTRRSLPSLEFRYSEPSIEMAVREIDPENLEHLPVGLDGVVYQWTDLHGEGVPGILSEHAGAWVYKRNLSPLSGQAAAFAPSESVAVTPNRHIAAGGRFMDLAGDGRSDLVVLDGPLPGFYEHDDGEGWQPFRPFTNRLNRNSADPNLRFIDLDGDGHADVLITEDDAFVWHASLAEEGFGPARRVLQTLDEESGPRLVFADGSQSIHLADFSGDGLTDIARIRNGEVCYWPNLGYGRFGAKVTMDHAPRFDHPDQFDPTHIRLADIDGSGTTDIIYLHRDGVRLYFNQSGNGWSEPQSLVGFPKVDDLTAVTTVDLLGNGTASLVWSSPLPADAGRQMRYVNLMGQQKPHLLTGSVNNLGAETRVHYAPSTKFYLQDKRAGRPWITRLPFPVHVVERVETYDHISRNRFATRYAYHHGYFDGEAREFRGFGMVEQWDTEKMTALNTSGDFPTGDNIDTASHVPPVHTKTWFHTGVYRGRGKLSRQYENEYYREPGLPDDDVRALLLPDTTLPAGLTIAEEREACRALKGMLLRQEVYADDADPDGSEAEIQRAATPYTVVEQDFAVRALQRRGSNRHGVFFVHPREAITFHYERHPADPRVQHALTLEVDDQYGNVLKSVVIGYGRRVPDLSLPMDEDRKKQTTPLMTYTENGFTNAVEAADAYRSPLSCDTRTFELSGYTPTGPAGRFQTSDFVEPDPATPGRLRAKPTDQVPYETEATGYPCRRPIEQVRTRYRPDDGGASHNDALRLLPLGLLESLALPGESYRLAFTTGLLDKVYQREGQPLISDPHAVLGGQGGDRGGYVDLEGDGNWWVPSGRVFFSDCDYPPTEELAYARAHFFLPHCYLDSFGQSTSVAYDAHDLLMRETRDALGNTFTVGERRHTLPDGTVLPARPGNDYRVLQPWRVMDPNRNRSQVAFDALGMVVGTAVMGKPEESLGDSLDGFESDLSQIQIDDFVDGPVQAAADPKRTEATAETRALLAEATSRIVYDLDRYQRLGEPALAATIVRETHLSDLPDGKHSRLQVSFSYSDGFGREIQKKIQAEPGGLDPQDDSSAQLNPRWVGSGWTIFNNKGNPVRQYEPFFTDTHRFELGTAVGVSSVLFYDPLNRAVATLHPNHAYAKVVFDPWKQSTYDVNDTISVPDDPGDPPFDPKDDPDVGGWFKRLPDDDYLPTWYDLRADPAKALAMWPDGNAQGQPMPGNAKRREKEKEAAEKAAAHADTPATAHFDALGRTFLTLADNGPDPAQPDQHLTLATRVDLDIEGNQREVIDANDRVVMRYDYGVLGNRIHQQSMEAGERWMLNDVGGKLIRAWDSRGHTFTTAYDALRRPVAQTVRGTTDESDPRTLNRDILVDQIDYGDALANAESFNLRTRIYRHSDSAGIVTHAKLNDDGNPIVAYDFKGNLRASTRRLVEDYKTIPDWSADPALEEEWFESSTSHDALNRPTQSIAPHSSLAHAKRTIIQPVFNEANLLERVDVWLERASELTGLLDPQTDAPSPVGVANVDYNAKGQRLHIDYKNGATTHYRYDPDTFRLIHLYTRRGDVFTEDCENPDPPPPAMAAPENPPSGKPCGLQNLHYTYDPAGNITHIRDDAQQTLFFKNRQVGPSNDYTYDALYRLIEATGREHLGQNGQPVPHSTDDAARSRRPHPNDGLAMARYCEKYVYDAVGNFINMSHHSSCSNGASWTRNYTYNEESLIEPGKQSNRLSRTAVDADNLIVEPYNYDTHGNMTRMPHLPLMAWNYRDELLKTSRQHVQNSGCTPETTHYAYDATGQRVRKVTERHAPPGHTPARMQERIYLGGFEIHRSYAGDGETITLERETLHVMDDKRRIALVETRIQGADPSPKQLIRYQFGNHLGSSSLELDDGAAMISFEEYTPYGSTSYQGVRNQLELPKRYRFTGKERDEESCLYYHGARYYSAWLGRWLTTDRVGLQNNTNLYLYVSDRPTILYDPSGNEGVVDDVVAGVKGVPKAVAEPLLLASDTIAAGYVWAYNEHLKDPSDPYIEPTDINFMSGTAERMRNNIIAGEPNYQNWRAGLVMATAMPTGGATPMVDNWVTVFEKDLSPKQAQSLLVQGATQQVVLTGVAMGWSKSTGSGLTGRGPIPDLVGETAMGENLVQGRVEVGKQGEGNATFAQGKDAAGKMTEVMQSLTKEEGGTHAEPQVMSEMSPAGGKIVVVDQVPCEQCWPALSGGADKGTQPNLYQGSMTGSLRVITVRDYAKPSQSPRSAAIKAAKGKAKLTTKVEFVRPFSPPIVPTRPSIPPGSPDPDESTLFGQINHGQVNFN